MKLKMAKIFINYRRDDSQYQADRLCALLEKSLQSPKHNIFIDVDNIPGGVDFVEHLDAAVSQADVLLVLIGKHWLTTIDPSSGLRRLNDPNDFVRIEIERALAREIPVVPILLDGASMPTSEELPDSLKPLIRRNGFTVSRLSFESDVRRLVNGLPVELSSLENRTRHGGRNVVMATASVAAAAILGGSFIWAFDPLNWRSAEIGGNPATATELRAISASRAAAMDGCLLFTNDSTTPIDPKSNEISSILGMKVGPDIPDLQEVVVLGFDDPDSSRSRAYASDFSARRASNAAEWLQKNVPRNMTVVPYPCGKERFPEYYAEWICGAKIMTPPATCG